MGEAIKPMKPRKAETTDTSSIALQPVCTGRFNAFSRVAAARGLTSVSRKRS